MYTFLRLAWPSIVVGHTTRHHSPAHRLSNILSLCCHRNEQHKRSPRNKGKIIIIIIITTVDKKGELGFHFRVNICPYSFMAANIFGKENRKLKTLMAMAKGTSAPLINDKLCLLHPTRTKARTLHPYILRTRICTVENSVNHHLWLHPPLYPI
jgi:hypothetical protein